MAKKEGYGLWPYLFVHFLPIFQFLKKRQKWQKSKAIALTFRPFLPLFSRVVVSWLRENSGSIHVVVKTILISGIVVN
jgi:hypothetical protein